MPIRQIPRRAFLAGLALVPLATACGSRNAQPAAGQTTPANQDGPQLVVYKSPT
jgi:hypothetical protein